MTFLKRSFFGAAIYLAVIFVLGQADYADRPIINFANYFYLAVMVAVPLTLFFPSISRTSPYVPLVVWAAVYLVLLQFIDRSPYRGIRKRPLAIAIVTLCLLILLYLTALRQRSPWTAWPSGHPPELPPGILLNERAEQGRQLFVTYGCNSCHAVSGDGPSFAPDLARLPSPRPLDWFHQYVLEPPPGIAMPSYRGRISSEHLALVAEFCHVSQTFPRGE